MTLLLALALLAQVQAYTTADPVNPERLGLATMDGRYMVELGDGCEGIAADMNVTLIGQTDDAAAITVDGTAICSLRIEQRMSDVPCFTIDDVCDVRAEVDE